MIGHINVQTKDYRRENKFFISEQREDFGVDELVCGPSFACYS
jgi:hypothetical protein